MSDKKPGVIGVSEIDHGAGKVTVVDHREVFDVAAQLRSAVLSVVSPLKNDSAIVQFIGHSRAINFHT